MNYLIYFCIAICCACSHDIPGRPSTATSYEKKRMTDHTYPIDNINNIGGSAIDAQIAKKTINKKNTTAYNISNQYISDYNNILNGNGFDNKTTKPNTVQSIFQVLKKQQAYSTIGKYTKHPVRNIIAVQKLHDKYDKMTIPVYMAQYITPYYKHIQDTTNQTTNNDITFDENINDITSYNGSMRDKVVASKLMWYEIYGLNNVNSFTEETIK